MFCLRGCETWCVILRVEHKQRLWYKDEMLRGIFGSKKQEVGGGWRYFVMSYIICSFTKYYLCKQIRMGKTRRMHEVHGKCLQILVRKT